MYCNFLITLPFEIGSFGFKVTKSGSLVLIFCNFTNIVNAKGDGEGELYLSQNAVKNFIKYSLCYLILSLLSRKKYVICTQMHRKNRHFC